MRDEVYFAPEDDGRVDERPMDSGLSEHALNALSPWISRRLRMAAWEEAYNVHLRRAPGENGHRYAKIRADRFWPLYLATPPEPQTAA